MSLKYVRFPDLFIAIVSPTVNHAVVASQFGDAHGKPVSAGFVKIVNGKIICHGRSDTLDLGQLVDDEDLVAAFLCGGI